MADLYIFEAFILMLLINFEKPKVSQRLQGILRRNGMICSGMGSAFKTWKHI
jgi:hypothetical protein